MAVEVSADQRLRPLRVLEALADRGELRAAELALLLEIPRPTLYRTLTALEGRGYVSRGTGPRTYALGPAAAALGSRARQSLLAPLAHQALVRLRDETGETANLALLSGQRVFYADILHSTYSLRPAAEVGDAVPVHATAVGKAILAQLRPDERVLLAGHAPFKRYTGSTLTTVEELERELVRTRKRGYAVDAGEAEVGASCVAVAVVGPGGAPAGAISVAGARERMRDAIPQLGAVVQRVAAELSDEYARRLNSGEAVEPASAGIAAAANNEEEDS